MPNFETAPDQPLTPEQIAEAQATHTEGGLDDLLAEVKTEVADVPEVTAEIPVEAAPVEQEVVNPEHAEQQPGEGLEDFLARTQEETKDVEVEQIRAAEEQKRIEEEKHLEAMEVLKPKIEQIGEMNMREGLYKGKEYYYALNNNFDGYKAAVLEDSKDEYANAVLSDEIEKEYKGITGKEKYYRENLRGNRNLDYTSLRGRSGSGGLSEEDYLAARGLAGFSEHPLEGSGFKRTQLEIPGMTREHWLDEKDGKMPVTTASELLSELKRVREYRNSERYNSDNKSPEKAERSRDIGDSIYKYCEQAQGVALAALESADLKVAAQALAFAESIKKMSPFVLDQVKDGISKLTPVQKKEFVTTYEAEKNKYKQEVTA